MDVRLVCVVVGDVLVMQINQIAGAVLSGLVSDCHFVRRILLRRAWCFFGHTEHAPFDGHNSCTPFEWPTGARVCMYILAAPLRIR